MLINYKIDQAAQLWRDTAENNETHTTKKPDTVDKDMKLIEVLTPSPQ
ncbi:hypothetical protein N9E48_09840 [Paracoccaceae bacterium]|nr:hypothetical protein [Paracoccaceae bacterium]